jgi:glucose-1-phosphate cytidylyltransferase
VSTGNGHGAALKTVILCGGKGTRAYPHTSKIPKPLMEVGGRPILARVMEIYAQQGFRNFVLAAGFKLELIEGFARTCPSQWNVTVVDTGEETNTGARVLRCRDVLHGTFFLTYADGVGNVDLPELLRFHHGHRGAATVTTVPLRSQYGTLETSSDGRVDRFVEKPVLSDHWINAGFMVLDERAFAFWEGEDLERDTLPALAATGELYAFRHEGFWKSMDTYKDALELGALCDGQRPTWLNLRVPVGAQ